MKVNKKFSDRHIVILDGQREAWKLIKALVVFQVDSIVAAEYELEHLLLEGHCFDVSTGQPPRGLQFTLGTASDPVLVDTIVMANLVRDFLTSLYDYCVWVCFCFFY